MAVREKQYKIALIQMRSIQGDTIANLDHAEKFIREAAEKGARIACLPELFYTGYHLDSENFQRLAEPADGFLIQHLSKLARELQIYIIGGYAEATALPGRIYNSAIFIDDQGHVIGNMRKVYAWGQEKLKFREGNAFPVYDTPLGKIGLMICYDVEYPEPARIMVLKGAQLIFVPAVWSIPAERRWHVDLAGNALFNVLYMAGSNPVGDGACGCSKVVSPMGEVIVEASSDAEEIVYAEISLEEVVNARAKLPYFNDFKEDTFSMSALEKY
ncbi:nitrilase-related carbon-nitrogen hydrolase [Acidaminobacter hydrogenoformans]|uniref:Predicted amidohydrolase n=1 Tax=Acidaminobacter hydrogenoformans DSM 2784 TaxID=1120920 RepID=A0A1G5RR81_9FIRM|nr:nitrilase-related carbon-nitrogen hydrolase [Acidaminobacter hydrogenoformans]SCZ76380.1 Predicted amidohydrolase [Acidaminobacter hydrogenoformans DSM 2784]